MNAFQLGNAVYNNGQYEEAIENYSKAIRERNCEDKDLYCCYYNIGVCHLKLKNYTNSLDYLRNAYELIMLKYYNKDSAEELKIFLSKVFFNIGFCYAKLDNAKLSFINFNRAYSLNPDDSDCRKAIKLASKELDIIS